MSCDDFWIFDIKEFDIYFKGQKSEKTFYVPAASRPTSEGGGGDHMVPYGTIWYHMVPYGTIWYQMDHIPNATIWYHMVLYGTMMVP